MTATAPVINNRPQRKLLSEELDRLDSIVDSIAEGLPMAVAAAAREGTRQAVRDAIIEIATNPELRSLFQMPMAPAAPAPSEPTPPAGPSLWSRIKSKIVAAKAVIVERAQVAKAIVVKTWKTLIMIVPVKQIAMVVGVGMMAGVAIHFAPVGLSGAIAVVAGAVSVGLVRVGSWFRRSARTLLATG